MEIYLSDVANKYRDGDYTNKMPSPYEMKVYSKNHVFDENKSVKWNNEQIELKNKERELAFEKYRKESSRLTSLLEADIINAIVYEYKFNNKQANLIYQYAYQEHHSYGYLEIINSLYELCEVFDDFKKLGRGE